MKIRFYPLALLIGFMLLAGCATQEESSKENAVDVDTEEKEDPRLAESRKLIDRFNEVYVANSEEYDEIIEDVFYDTEAFKEIFSNKFVQASDVKYEIIDEHLSEGENQFEYTVNATTTIVYDDGEEETITEEITWFMEIVEGRYKIIYFEVSEQ